MVANDLANVFRMNSQFEHSYRLALGCGEPAPLRDGPLASLQLPLATQVLARFPSQGGTEVDYQIAAPTESRTPNLHRATIAQQRVRMEGWRQRRLGSMGIIWKR